MFLNKDPKKYYVIEHINPKTNLIFYVNVSTSLPRSKTYVRMSNNYKLYCHNTGLISEHGASKRKKINIGVFSIGEYNSRSEAYLAADAFIQRYYGIYPLINQPKSPAQLQAELARIDARWNNDKQMKSHTLGE